MFANNDLYTKAVLTVIAGALVWVGLKLPAFVSSASAQGSPQHVVIVGWSPELYPTKAINLKDVGLPTTLVGTHWTDPSYSDPYADYSKPIYVVGRVGIDGTPVPVSILPPPDMGERLPAAAAKPPTAAAKPPAK